MCWRGLCRLPPPQRPGRRLLRHLPTRRPSRLRVIRAAIHRSRSRGPTTWTGPTSLRAIGVIPVIAATRAIPAIAAIIPEAVARTRRRRLPLSRLRRSRSPPHPIPCRRPPHRLRCRRSLNLRRSSQLDSHFGCMDLSPEARRRHRLPRKDHQRRPRRRPPLRRPYRSRRQPSNCHPRSANRFGCMDGRRQPRHHPRRDEKSRKSS